LISSASLLVSALLTEAGLLFFFFFETGADNILEKQKTPAGCESNVMRRLNKRKKILTV
jgi:hypothetical protein